MALSLGDAILFIGGDDSKLKKSLKDTEKAVTRWSDSSTKSVKRWQESYASLGAFAAKLGVGISLGMVGKNMLQTANDFQLANNQLIAVLRSTRQAAGLNADSLVSMSDALSKASRFTQEEIMHAQNLLLTFTQIKGPEFQSAIGTILDMATAMGSDLKGATIQVGKALNDPIRGVSALGEVGVSFNKKQRDMIKYFAETNRLAYAQKIIIGELGNEFGGSAKQGVESFIGQLDQLKKNLSDLAESKRGQQAVGAAASIVQDLNAAVNSTSISDFLDTQQQRLDDFMGMFGFENQSKKRKEMQGQESNDAAKKRNADARSGKLNPASDDRTRKLMIQAMTHSQGVAAPTTSDAKSSGEPDVPDPAGSPLWHQTQATRDWYKQKSRSAEQIMKDAAEPLVPTGTSARRELETNRPQPTSGTVTYNDNRTYTTNVSHGNFVAGDDMTRAYNRQRAMSGQI